MFAKRIWFLWYQGMDQAPPLVRSCLESWRHWNPDWHVEILDRERLKSLMPDVLIWPERCPGMTFTSLSDLVRINLLYRYGGVWVDATCLCRKPLDAWLPPLMEAGFFGFSDPAPDRRIASWFLAAEAANPLVGRWHEAANVYWERGKDRTLVDLPKLQGSPEFACFRSDRSLWFDEERPDYLAHYPYFWLHYLFERLLRDAQFAAQWGAIPRLTADIPHRLQRLGLSRPVSDAVKLEYRHGLAPLYKLTYKLELEPCDGSTLLGYALNPGNW